MKLHACPDRGKLRRWVSRALGVLVDDVAQARSMRGTRRARTLRQRLTEPAHLLLRFVGEAEGRALNQAFRQSDHATNVLTFPYTENPGISADIVLCAPVVENEAKAQGKTLTAHYAHLVIHGVLHAAGLEHESDDEARIMEDLERKVLAAFRIGDPYSSSA